MFSRFKQKIRCSRDCASLLAKRGLFSFFCLFPLQNKIIATTMRGRKYGDNPQFIFEKIHNLRPEFDLVWLVNDEYSVELPKWLRKISYYKKQVRLIYELSTAKVWINTHRFERYWRKRRGQFVIETWHGGLGVKKIEGDLDEVRNSKRDMAEIRNTCFVSDVFVSQSSHLSNIYRSAFGYKGTIWKCGYPKNDCLFIGSDSAKNKIRTLYKTKEHILLYAPTMREGDQDSSKPTKKPYSIEWDALYSACCEKFGGDWTILVKWHPVLMNKLSSDFILSKHVINVTNYSDMQELLKASDVVVSDYSSCIFDAALLDIPCFTYATDFEEYKSKRGVYYEMTELPFPYARNNDELKKNIMNFNQKDYLRKWNAFKEKTGLYETGHAADDVAKKIIQFVDSGKIKWNVEDLIM